MLGILAAPAVAGQFTMLFTFNGGKGGGNPQGGLFYLGGTLYGTTNVGGRPGCYSDLGCGTTFSFVPGTGEKVMKAFRDGADAANPAAGLASVSGTLFGTSWYGGTGSSCNYYYGVPYGCGTVFSITPGGQEKVLHAFQSRNPIDGSFPAAGLIAVGNTLYGTTNQGGTGNCDTGGNACGTVYSITPGGAEKVLYSFKGGKDGANPGYVNLLNVNGTLNGTTYWGGETGCYENLGCGTVFSVTPGGAEKVLYAFKNGKDGANPLSGLIQVGSTLYGTAEFGGGYGCGGEGCGAVFAFTP